MTVCREWCLSCGDGCVDLQHTAGDGRGHRAVPDRRRSALDRGSSAFSPDVTGARKVRHGSAPADGPARWINCRGKQALPACVGLVRHYYVRVDGCDYCSVAPRAIGRFVGTAASATQFEVCCADWAVAACPRSPRKCRDERRRRPAEGDLRRPARLTAKSPGHPEPSPHQGPNRSPDRGRYAVTLRDRGRPADADPGAADARGLAAQSPPQETSTGPPMPVSS